MDKRTVSGCIAAIVALMLFALVGFMFGAQLQHVQATPWGELPLLDVAGIFVAMAVGGAIAGRRFQWIALGMIVLLWALVLVVLLSLDEQMSLARIWRFNRLAIVLNLLLAWLGAIAGAWVGARYLGRREAA
jgi:hypothetical protein